MEIGDRGVADAFGRPLKNLRVSVIDRCNLRCTYCMPEAEYEWLPREDILSFEEIEVLVDVFGSLGVEKVRITGGEPLLRRNLPDLVRRLAAKAFIRDLAMTTNGVLLAEQARSLREAGLGRVTVSLDTLQPERFERISQRQLHSRVLDGLRAVGEAGFTETKIDTVVVRGVNDDELVDLVELGKRVAAEVRFIEYMDVGGATGWDPALVVPRAEMLEILARHYDVIELVDEGGAAPATRFRLPDGTIVGIVSSTTQPFCSTCDRSRLTADGVWYRCLYATTGTDLGVALRRGATFAELREQVRAGWAGRRDQGAVDRLHSGRRGPLFPVTVLRRDPHLEMHTRGG